MPNPTGKAIILIVDDDAMHRSLVEKMLESTQYEIRMAGNAEQALQLARSVSPDVVLTDVSMPGVSGLELTRVMKADPLLRQISIVVLSGHGMMGDESLARNAGCDGYLSKPFRAADLRAEVELQLSRRSPRTS